MKLPILMFALLGLGPRQRLGLLLMVLSMVAFAFIGFQWFRSRRRQTIWTMVGAMVWVAAVAVVGSLLIANALQG